MMSGRDASSVQTQIRMADYVSQSESVLCTCHPQASPGIGAGPLTLELNGKSDTLPTVWTWS